ncbi:hypothetical protein [Lactiplantibacillus paraplantarum]|uniref:hypothetical protein n=1 Tax=Lactiplantibacillus paraplantarum TaxID=60520 RepID=UPI00207458F8|nr:hypothetical protein [Lactiplantibacillus paraplantarum]
MKNNIRIKAPNGDTWVYNVSYYLNYATSILEIKGQKSKDSRMPDIHSLDGKKFDTIECFGDDTVTHIARHETHHNITVKVLF